MEQKDKELLLKDLCARLPYGIKVCSPDKKICSICSVPYISVVSVVNGSGQSSHPIKDIKPYLRPMSSMTDEEIKEYSKVSNSEDAGMWTDLDWLNAHHFDYRGLIEKGLALEEPEGMYKKF